VKERGQEKAKPVRATLSLQNQQLGTRQLLPICCKIWWTPIPRCESCRCVRCAGWPACLPPERRHFPRAHAESPGSIVPVSSAQPLVRLPTRAQATKRTHAAQRGLDRPRRRTAGTSAWRRRGGNVSGTQRVTLLYRCWYTSTPLGGGALLFPHHWPKGAALWVGSPAAL